MMPAKQLISACLVFAALTGPISSSSWQSSSPFTITELDARWGSDWSIRGINWRHHKAEKLVKGPYDDSVIPTVTHGFSTCPGMVPPKRNGLSSGVFHLPQGTSLPAIVSAEFSFLVAENCIQAQRPYCASLELWMLEGVAPTIKSLLDNNTAFKTPPSPYTKASFLTDLAVMPGTSLLAANELLQSTNNTVRTSTVSFSISRPPFKLQFRDRRGACLTVTNAKLRITSCLVGSAKKSPFATDISDLSDLANRTSSSSTTTTTSSPSTESTTLPPTGMTTPSTADLLTSLDCKCPAGYRRSSYDMCEACPPHSYADEPHANSFCKPCPSRAMAPFAGSTICVCSEGSFRAPKENPREPCTTPPSHPRQMVATYYDVHTVTINWTEPDNLGGRDDISYMVKCIAGCDGRDVNITRRDPLGELRVADIKTKNSLETSFITIRIYALNGVSAVAGTDYAQYFQEVLTLRSSDADAAYAHIPDRVFILVGIFGGAGLVAAFFLVYGLSRHFHERRRGQPIIVIGSNSDDTLDPSRTNVTKPPSSVLTTDGDDQPDGSKQLSPSDDAKVPLVGIEPAYDAYQQSAASPAAQSNSPVTSDESRLVSP